MSGSAEITIVNDARVARKAEEYLTRSVLMSNDIETDPKNKLITVNGFSGVSPTGEIRTYVFPYFKGFGLNAPLADDFAYGFDVQRTILTSPVPKVYQNGAYDLFWLAYYGIFVENYAHDTMTGWWSILPELDKNLAFISSVLLDDYVYWKGGRKSDSWHNYLIYNGLDCERTLRNMDKLIQLFLAPSSSQARQNYIAAHSRVVTCIAMSLKGMDIDQTRLDEHAADLHKLAEEKLEHLRYILHDPNFNPNSPAQKKDLLYVKLGAKLRNPKGRFVKTLAEASTGAIPMRGIKADHPLFRLIIQAIDESQQPAKQISNVINQRKPSWNRFYTAYNGVGTGTTRLSSSETPLKFGGNAQNIRKHYRDWIQADKRLRYETVKGTVPARCFILDIDFSAADDVFVSFESGDPRKIELFRSGKDTHCENAALFFDNWTYEQVLAGKKAKDERVVHPITGVRQITKKLAHGCNYLMAALTLLMSAGRDAIVAAAKEVGHADAGYWSQERLAEFCLTREELYRNHYTRFKRDTPDSWYADVRNEVAETGGFTTPFLYFQRFIGDPNDDGTLRAAAATAGQAGTAGRINMAMEELDHGRIPPVFRDAPNPAYGLEPLQVRLPDFGVDMRLQTHDSLTWVVDPSYPEWKEGVRRVFEVMRRDVIIRNKLTGELETFAIPIESEVGFAWGNAMKETPSTIDGVIATLNKL